MMKTNHIIPAAAVLCAAVSTMVCASAAADPKPRQERIEKRIVVDSAGRPETRREPVTFLGLDVAPAPEALAAQLRLPEGQGLLVNFVAPDSPAEKAGLKQHDLLIRLDDQILIDPRQLSVLVRNRKEGDKVNLTYMRAGAEASATATLGTHEVPVDQFRRIGRGMHLPHFEHGVSGWSLSEDSVEHLRGLERKLEHDFDGRLHVPVPPPAPGAAWAPQVRIYRPGTSIVLSDDAGTIELRSDDAERNLRASDNDGKVVFDGPIDTPEQRAALPENLRVRLEKLEGMELLDPPARPAPFRGVAPAVPVAPPPPI